MESKGIRWNLRKSKGIQVNSIQMGLMEFMIICCNSNNTKKFKRIQKIFENFKRIQGDSKEYERIQGHLKEFKRIQGNSP